MDRIEQKVCYRCGAPDALLVCPKCQAARYCSASCQKNALESGHDLVCDKVSPCAGSMFLRTPKSKYLHVPGESGALSLGKMREHALASVLDVMHAGPVLRDAGVDAPVRVFELVPGGYRSRNCLDNCIQYIEDACRDTPASIDVASKFRLRGVWVLYGLSHADWDNKSSEYCFCVKLVGHVVVENTDTGVLLDTTMSEDQDPRLSCIMCEPAVDELLAGVLKQCREVGRKLWFDANWVFMSVGICPNKRNDAYMSIATGMYLSEVNERSRDGMRKYLKDHALFGMPVKDMPFLQSTCWCGVEARAFELNAHPFECPMCNISSSSSDDSFL